MIDFAIIWIFMVLIQESLSHQIVNFKTAVIADDELDWITEKNQGQPGNILNSHVPIANRNRNICNNNNNYYVSGSYEVCEKLDDHNGIDQDVPLEYNIGEVIRHS